MLWRPVADKNRSRVGHLPAHQWFLQSETKALDTELEKPGRLRAESSLNEHEGGNRNATGPDAAERSGSKLQKGNGRACLCAA